MPRVLVVDDEPDILSLLIRLLKNRGIDVIKAGKAVEAVERMESITPDAIILDVMMPDMDGWELGRLLKKDSRFKETPVIMLTVLADENDRLKSFDYAGADWHISTPFDTDHLFFILDAAIKKQKGREIEDKIKRAVERDDKMRKVVDMINPKLLEHKYDFLDQI